MKSSTILLVLAVLISTVVCNDRGRQNDWHKVNKPAKFKPDAPRNIGKTLRTSSAPVRVIFSNLIPE
jgi:hypothetical protein